MIRPGLINGVLLPLPLPLVLLPLPLLLLLLLPLLLPCLLHQAGRHQLHQPLVRRRMLGTHRQPARPPPAAASAGASAPGASASSRRPAAGRSVTAAAARGHGRALQQPAAPQLAQRPHGCLAAHLHQVAAAVEVAALRQLLPLLVADVGCHALCGVVVAERECGKSMRGWR